MRPVFSGDATICGRTHPLHDAAAQPAIGEGQAVVRRAGDSHRRHDGRAGRRSRPPGRADRHQGLHDRRSEPHRDRRADAPSLSGRVPFDCRRRRSSCAARCPPRCSAAPSSCATACTRSDSNPTWTCSTWRRWRRSASSSVGGSRDAAGAVRYPGPGAADAARREQSCAPGRFGATSRRRARTTARSCSDERRSCGARSSSKATGTWSRAARSTFSIRARSSRSSTSRPRRACVSPKRGLPCHARRQRDVRRPHEPRGEFRSAASARGYRPAAASARRRTWKTQSCGR